MFKHLLLIVLLKRCSVNSFSVNIKIRTNKKTVVAYYVTMAEMAVQQTVYYVNPFRLLLNILIFLCIHIPSSIHKPQRPIQHINVHTLYRLGWEEASKWLTAVLPEALTYSYLLISY